MIDINLIRTNPELVKNNIKKKFQEHKLVLVDEVLDLDKNIRKLKQNGDDLRTSKNQLSSKVGFLMKQKLISDAEQVKQEVLSINKKLVDIQAQEQKLTQTLKAKMMSIPNIIDDDVPIGKDDSENVQYLTTGEAHIRDYEIPYHADILENLGGLDLDSARKTSGNGFYFLTGDIARLHSAILSYARDFMIDRGFTYVIPPYMIRSDVVAGVMSFEEMDNMMYKIEGEDLFLIGTSEHSMIGRFKDTIVKEENLPILLTSYSPCFRKEVGAHGIEERGVYRVHQFEKQEMIVICKPEESRKWYEELSKSSVEFFKSLEIPTRLIECCSGDLADLKVKSCDIEAWSPRQKKYFGELGSCSNLSDAQARRLGIRYKVDNKTIFAHTLNNTVVAPPRMLIAYIENHLNKDGSVNIPKALQPYMGGKSQINTK